MAINKTGGEPDFSRIPPPPNPRITREILNVELKAAGAAPAPQKLKHLLGVHQTLSHPKTRAALTEREQASYTRKAEELTQQTVEETVQQKLDEARKTRHPQKKARFLTIAMEMLDNENVWDSLGTETRKNLKRQMEVEITKISDKKTRKAAEYFYRELVVAPKPKTKADSTENIIDL